MNGFLYDLVKPLKTPLIKLAVTLILVLGLMYYLFGTIRFKDYGDFFIRLLDVAAWPTVLLILAILFHGSIVKLLDAVADYLKSRVGPKGGEG